MTESIKQTLGFVVAAAMVLAGIAVLNVGSAASSLATECEGGAGGGSPSPTGSASPSPTETDDGLPSLPPILPSRTTESPSPTASDTGPTQARRCESEITINFRGPNRERPERREFAGRVRSDEDACEAGRKVVLKKDRRDRRDLIVDTTLTNDRGTWRVPVRRANGRYYAKTPQEKVPSDQGRVTCGADRSQAIRV